MDSWRYYKFLTGIITSLVMFFLFSNPGLVAMENIMRASVTSDGVQRNSDSHFPSISANEAGIFPALRLQRTIKLIPSWSQPASIETQRIAPPKGNSFPIISPGSQQIESVVQAGWLDNLCLAEGVDFGAYVASDPPTSTAIREFENLSGRHVCSVMWYQGWDAYNHPPFPTSALNEVRFHDGYNTHTILHLTWEPWVKLSDVAGGLYDSYLTSYASDAKNWGETIRLRFAHEMIQDNVYCWGQPGCTEWYPWQDQPADYVAAFQHVHNIFTDAGAANVEFVWCPNNYPFDTNIVQQYYPGQGYVDWLCMDGYNPTNKDNKPGWPDWLWFDDIYYSIYHTFVEHQAIFGNKPVMVGEFASCEAGPYELPGQTKSAWITNAFERIKSPDYVSIKAFYWFNVNKECDWRINSSSQSLSSYQTAISDPYFSSHPYTISGNAGVAGVTLSYTDGTAKTAISLADGSYSLQVSHNWSGTVTPTHPCFTFDPENISYVNVTSNQGTQNYTATIAPASGCANINVDIGGVNRGIYGIPPQGSIRQNYAGVDSGPVKVESANGVPIIAAIRDAWAVNGVTTSFSQLMGLPLEQLSNKYVFPGYNNVTLNEQLRIANVDTVQTTVTVMIGGVLRGTYTLYPPGSALGVSSVRVNYPGLDSGPVVIEGTAGVKIIAAIREAWAVNGVTTSFIQLMGLPAGQLSNKYVFPAYNNVTLNEQLRIANVDAVQSTVTVTIGGVLRGTYTLYPPGSPLGPSAVRVNYAGLDSGPVVVEGTAGVEIISAIREAWAVNGVTTSFSQLMGMPAEQLSNKYLFPAYNNVTLNEQLRIANVDTVQTTVTVTIGGVLRGTYTLYPPGSPLGISAVRINYPSLDSGPVVVEGTSNVDIISAIREAWAVSGVTKSFVQLMGLPAGQLSTTFLFPAYNNITLNEQLRFGVP